MCGKVAGLVDGRELRDVSGESYTLLAHMLSSSSENPIDSAFPNTLMFSAYLPCRFSALVSLGRQRLIV